MIDWRVSPTTLRTVCKHCKAIVEFASEHSGERMECPSCHAQILLPSQENLKPVGNELMWIDKDGSITHVKCPFCRRMVLVEIEYREGRTFTRFMDHKTKMGTSCYGSRTCYRVAESI